MKKLFTLLCGASLVASAATAQNVPATDTWYHLVNGWEGSADPRYNSCLGMRDNVLGAATIEADNDQQVWKFVEKEGVYAIVNKAGEYIPVLATSFSTAKGTINQDTQFTPKAYTGEIPAEAFGYTLKNIGQVTAEMTYLINETTGIIAGDTYANIMPVKYLNSREEGAEPVDNTTLCLNFAANGRGYHANLWANENTAPRNSQSFVFVPVKEEQPEPVEDYSGHYRLYSGVRSACLGIRDGKFGVANVTANEPTQVWQFVEKEGVYAMVNMAGQYLPVTATSFSTKTGGTVYQDSQFAPQTYTGEIPAEAFGFTIIKKGNLAANSDYINETSGAKEGDPYIFILPVKYLNSKEEGAQPVDNTSYYLNMAAAGRDLLLNLWPEETGAPANSQSFILVEVPEPAEAEIAGQINGADINFEAGTVDCNGETVVITLTAPEGCDLYYKVTPMSSEEVEPQSDYTLAENGKAEITINSNCTLSYYTERDCVAGEVKTVTFTNTLAISEISAASTNAAAIFDLQGRKVLTPAHGLYIINGRKVLVK